MLRWVGGKRFWLRFQDKSEKFETIRLLQIPTSHCNHLPRLRDWSLNTGRGATKRKGGHMKFDPYKRGGGDGKSFSRAEGGGGHNKFWDGFYAVA